MVVMGLNGVEYGEIKYKAGFNPFNSKLSPICHLLALLESHHILHVSRIRVNNIF
jgi:hypothetical protein